MTSTHSLAEKNLAYVLTINIVDPDSSALLHVMSVLPPSKRKISQLLITATVLSATSTPQEIMPSHSLAEINHAPLFNIGTCDALHHLGVRKISRPDFSTALISVERARDRSARKWENPNPNPHLTR